MSNGELPKGMKQDISGNGVETTEKRNQFLDNFADWMTKAGLSPLEYELVEDRTRDHVTIWYFRKRIEEMQSFDKYES